MARPQARWPVTGCDRAGETPWFRRILETGEDINLTVQRFFLSPSSMAREFRESDISPKFRANGSTDPDDAVYRSHAANGFADWKLQVGGLVETPMEFSLADLRGMPAREQITRHDCVEGWSCIGKWRGVQLARILETVRLKPETRYILFSCADELEKTPDGSGYFYETHGLEDAFHPQTILAYELNGADTTDRLRRTAAPAHRAHARLQDGEIHHADRCDRQLRRYRRGQG